MADWILVPCLVALRTEFNRLAPDRDKTTDGSVGDAAHADSLSDHNPDETGHVPIHDADKVNEVHAIDVDRDLRLTDMTMEKVVQFLLNRCRSGQERRLRYVIYDRRIWKASNSWRQEAYSGSNAHTAHAHFSASYETKHEASTAPWGVEGLADDMSKADVLAGLAEFHQRDAQPAEGGITSVVGRNALDQGIPNGVTGGKTPTWAVLRDLGQQIMQTKSLVLALAERDFVDEPEVARIVLAGLSTEKLRDAILAAGLTPAAIAGAIPEDMAEEVVSLLAARFAD